MADGISNEDLENLKNHWKEAAEAQKRATDGLKGYYTTLKEIKEIRRNLNYLAKQENTFADQLKGLEKEQEKLIKKKLNNSKAFTKEDQKRLDAIKQSIVNRRKELDIIQKETSELKEHAKLLAESANSANLLTSSFVSLGKSLVGVGKSMYQQKGYLLDQQKAVRSTEMSMGVLSKQANAFRSNIYKASLSTNAIGVDTKQLAQMQGTYSEQIGRSVQLTQDGLEAMAELSKGTILGAEGAAQLAANMESFGISAAGTRDLVQEMLNTASKMGVNSAKVTKNLEQNLKLANKYHFKDGVQGISRMAISAAKLKLDIEGISGLADKVFRPEGAVEMSAQLQTMGGEFAKLADPFQLMFKARNDFEGFANDIGKATKEFVKFNSKTGEFDISGLQLDRMREISNITGISVDKLSEMGKEASKLDVIQSKMSSGLSDENSGFLSSIAQFNKNTGEWMATIDGTEKNVKLFSDKEIERIKKEKESLTERAKQSQTFDETWQNIKNTFKSTLLPFLEGLGEGLKEPMEQFMGWMKQTGGFDKLADIGKSLGRAIGDFVSGAGKMIIGLADFVKDNPLKSIATVFAGIGLFKAAQWVMNGIALGKGFNMVASAGGGGNPLSSGGGRGGMFSNMKNGWKGGKGFMGKMGGAMKGGLGGGYGIGKGLGGTMKGVGLGMLGGLGSMGLDAWRGSLDDQDSFGGKALGVGSKALEWAGYGSMLGPLGTLAGGLLGGGYGMWDENRTKDPQNTGAIQGFDDVIVRAGQPPIGINPADDVIAAKKDGPIDKALGTTSGSGGDVKVAFGNSIKIEGTLNIMAGNKQASIDIDDPIFMRNLSSLIQQELSKSIGGGKMSANPA